MDEDVSRRKRLKRLANDPIAIGDKVRYGTEIGVVVDEWGVFFACAECTKLLPDMTTNCCKNGSGDYRVPNKISGAGTFDVKFGEHDIRSINHWWLYKL